MIVHISSHINAYHTKRERTCTRNADGTRGNVGHGYGPHGNGKQAAARCPLCRHQFDSTGRCSEACDALTDEEAQRVYNMMCNSGGFTLNANGRPIAATGRGRKKQ